MLKYIDIDFIERGKVIFYFKDKKTCLHVFRDIILPIVEDKKIGNYIGETEKKDLYNIVAKEFADLPNNAKDYEYMSLHISGKSIKTVVKESKELKYINDDSSSNFDKEEGYVIKGKNSLKNTQDYKDKMETAMYNVHTNIIKYLDFLDNSLIPEEEYLKIIQ